MGQPPIARTARWRRRQVPKVRVTWLGQVGLLLSLCDAEIMKQVPMGLPQRVALTSAIVLVPFVCLCLWRAGLFPPERYYEDQVTPPQGPPTAP